MKNLIKIAIIATSSLTANLTLAAEAKSVCEAYAKAVQADSLKEIKSLEAFKDQLSSAEIAMVQGALIASGYSTKAFTPSSALNLFADKESGGSNGGYVTYNEVTYKNKKVTVAGVYFYPGDNQYGAIYEVNKLPNGYLMQDLIGTIGDGDVSCLKSVE